MRLVATLGLSIVLGLSAQAGAVALINKPPASAVFSGVHHEFGSVRQGEKLQHLFTFRNEAAVPLSIERVELLQPGMSSRFKRTIPAGAQGSITVAWDTRQMNGEAKSEAVVHFTDPGQPPVHLVLGAVIKPPIEISPYAAAFFSVYKGERARRELTVINNEELPLNITRVEAVGSHFLASIKTETPGKLYKLQVDIPPDVLPGRYREAIYLHTDQQAAPRIKVGVNVLVKEDLYVNPETVDYGNVGVGHLKSNPNTMELLNQTFLVKKRQGTFQIKSITSDVPQVRLRQEPATGRNEVFQITAMLDQQRLQPGRLKGTITIETDDPDFPILTVPVDGAINE